MEKGVTLRMRVIQLRIKGLSYGYCAFVYCNVLLLCLDGSKSALVVGF